MPEFQIVSDYKPSGDQPEAIEKLAQGVELGLPEQTLLGVTGSGKTFTMANIIQKVQRPTLVLAHNKTLAAQLCSEFREFFPHNAVEFFVSYYDYYQPEAYIPSTDTYIEKDSDVNSELDRLRHSATSALFERRDVIIVASVSCIYSLGDPIDYANMVISLRTGQVRDRDEICRKLVEIQYERNDISFDRNRFRVRGDTLEIHLAYTDDYAIRVEFFGDEIDRISEINIVTGQVRRVVDHVAIYPASHYVTPKDKLEVAIREIEEEARERVAFFEKEGKLIEAQRIKQRTAYDMEMLREIGFCSGIENYSRVLSGRAPGSAPHTLLDYFPKDFLMIIDESHVTLPQVRAMYHGDRARKEMLVDYGFRLPSAFDNRPLNFPEFQERINQVIYVSATPGEYERTRSSQTVEQVIRPTGLLDPEVIVRPVEGQIDDLIDEIRQREKQKERVLVTTLTKRMAEDLTDYLRQEGIRLPVYAPRYRHHRTDGAFAGSSFGRIPGAHRHQPSAGRPGPAGSIPGSHSGRRQGRLPAQRNLPHPDHRPGGPKCPRPGDHVRRYHHPFHGPGHPGNPAPPVHPGRLQQAPRHHPQNGVQKRAGCDRDLPGRQHPGHAGGQPEKNDQETKRTDHTEAGKGYAGSGQDAGIRIRRRAPGPAEKAPGGKIASPSQKKGPRGIIPRGIGLEKYDRQNHRQRGPGAQSEKCGCDHPPGYPHCGHRHFRLGQKLSGL